MDRKSFSMSSFTYGGKTYSYYKTPYLSPVSISEERAKTSFSNEVPWLWDPFYNSELDSEARNSRIRAKETILGRRLKEMMLKYDRYDDSKDPSVISSPNCIDHQNMRHSIYSLWSVPANTSHIGTLLYLIYWIRFECPTEKFTDTRDDFVPNWSWIVKTQLYTKYHHSRGKTGRYGEKIGLPSVLFFPVLEYAFEVREITSPPRCYKLEYRGVVKHRVEFSQLITDYVKEFSPNFKEQFDKEYAMLASSKQAQEHEQGREEYLFENWVTFSTPDVLEAFELPEVKRTIVGDNCSPECSCIFGFCLSNLLFLSSITIIIVSSIILL